MPAILKTIEDSTIVGMANNARFVKEFPFLKKALVAKKSHCSKCARKAGNKAANMQKVKQEIAGLSSSRKAVLKQLLDTKQARIIYRQPSGKTVKLTF